MKKKYLVGIDIGGTKILAGLVNQRFHVTDSVKSKVDANKGAKEFFKTLNDTVDALLEKKRIKPSELLAIGVGCPGIVRVPQGIIELSPNLSFLKNAPLASRLRSRFKCPVVVENDVNAGLYGEFRLGAAKGCRDVLGVFMGTGVGGALILNGEIHRGFTGGAGEIGHTFLSIPRIENGEIRGDTLESLTGRLAIAAESALLVLRQKAPAMFKEAGYDVKKIKSKTLRRSIRSGDTAVKNLIVEKSRILGVSLANVVNLLSPERIVLGGGVVEALGDLIIPAAESSMRAFAMKPLSKPVKVVPSALMDFAIVLGSAKLAEESLKKRR